MQFRYSHSRWTKRLQILVATVCVMAHQATSYSFEQDEPEAGSAEELRDLRESLSSIWDSHLRSACLEMYDAVVPKDEMSLDGKTLEEQSIAICLFGRRTFCYYERYQLRRGDEEALDIRREIVQLYRISLERVQDLYEPLEHSDSIESVIHSLQVKIDVLAHNLPIPPPELPEV